MSGENYYLLSALPALGDFDTPPPLTPREFLDHVEVSPPVHRLVSELFLGDDLLLRGSVLAGQVEPADAEPTVLTAGQLADEEPLPATLIGEEQDEIPRRVAQDALWEAYFRHAAAAAEDLGSGLLDAWVRHEVALRNALAAARAKTLELEIEPYLLATDLADDSAFDSLISDWAAAENPLTALRVIDRHRWQWLADRDGWFTFADDELLAYGAKLMLLGRWQRLQAEPTKATSASA